MFKRIGLFLWLSCIMQAGYAAETTVAMQARQVGAHSYYVQGQSGAASAGNQGFMSNAGFVVTSDGVVVFDALGTPPLAEKLIAEIRKITAQPIRRVIVSHWHADSLAWLAALDQLSALQPRTMVPGHGAASVDPGDDLTLTRDYLRYLRSSMGKAVADFVPFDEAYAATDWRPWEKLPAFDVANRANAYNTYLLMEQEALRK